MSNKRDFKVGDKITYKNDETTYEGVVVEAKTQDSILVHLKDFEGHNAFSAKCGPYRTRDYWWVNSSKIEFAKNECIVIYRKGQEVIALDKATGKKAVAKCSPDDEFDFNIGSKLAFERLLGIEEQKEAKPKFLEKFEEGKLYVFRKEIYEKHKYPLIGFWTKQCDGKLVDVKNKTNGMIDGYYIDPMRCEEIGYKKEGADNE